MDDRTRLRPWAPVVLAGVVLALGAGPVFEPPERNLYEWSAIAPVVVVVEFVEQDGRWALFDLEEVLRGDAGEGSRIRIDRKTANRARGSRAAALDLEPGRAYVALLERSDRSGPDDFLTFDLVRGVRGVRPLPPEGAPAVVDALREFVEIQDLGDFSRMWTRFREILGGNNPVATRTVLEQHLKFRHGDAELVPVLAPLLDHPGAPVRAATARLLGIAVRRSDPAALRRDPAFGSVRSALLAKARRDPSVDVRVAATESYAALPADDTRDVLRAIAESDPDQAVRYAAERALFEGRSSDPASDASRPD